MKLPVCMIVFMFAVACLVGPVTAAEGRFSVRDLDGPSAFAFDGFVTVDSTMIPAAAVGRFTADGDGTITAGVRTLVVGGTAVEQTFTCLYTVNPNGTGTAECEITTGPDESFDFVIVKRKKEAFFTGTTPGVTIRGVAERQH